MFNWLRRRSPQAQRLERLNAYIDGELTSAESTLFEIEMEEDDALRADVNALRSVQQALQQVPAENVPRNFTIAVEQPKQASRTPPLALAGAFASFILVAGIIFTLLSGGLDDRQTISDLTNQPTNTDSDASMVETVVEVTRIVEQVVEVVKEVEVEVEKIVEVEVSGETIVEEVVVTTTSPPPSNDTAMQSPKPEEAMEDADDFRAPGSDSADAASGDVTLFTINPSDFSGTIEVHVDALDSFMIELANRFDNAGFNGDVAFSIGSAATLEDFCASESIDLVELDGPISSAEYNACSAIDAAALEFVFVNDAEGNPLYLATSIGRMRERPQVAALLNYALNNVNTIIGSPPTTAVETFDYTPVSDTELSQAKLLWLDVITQ